MKKIHKIVPILFLSLAFGLYSCDEDPTDALQEIIKEDKGYLPVISKFTLVSPGTTTVQPGAQRKVDLRYWSEGEIEAVQFWMVKGEEETLISEQAYSPAYSFVTRTDSLIFNYTVPATMQVGDEFAIQARVINEGLEEYPASASINLKVVE